MTINGFVVDDAVVPPEHLVRAAPAKDSIAALDRTSWVTPEEATIMLDDDYVLSVTIGAETRAYPLRIMVWHEIVNDLFGERPITVTYSALSGSGVVFDPGVNPDGTRRMFGVSGLLYNSCLLMYDRATESLWSQLRMTGVTGATGDEELVSLPSRRMKWAAWKKLFPTGKVLSTDTGHDADYAGDWPYGDYEETKATIFPFDINRDEFGTKERMIAMKEGWAARSWPLETIRKKKQLYDAIGARPINVVYDETTDDVVVTDIMTGEPLPTVSVYWFAWQAFYPETSVWMPLR
ncbi:DUF3179 domain-containing (seleno)protein [Synoicihabitans lomoniglobus]|uniref:DUF3179 domain-containing (Seleno)protein n=1 Tax=Synoicihabitans lomoniglobus TaxID=2909285 RepID=A0AAF0CQZ4_9BACT|nr:DUF3179 domain-containing protein [Opitutaceae bacterium LMO-M01]WED66439.1 DUF3179 domain-containing (seleno)protein [Opitutaceae bacterium LMO-M01]